MQTLKKLYARLDALCRARPKTVAAAIMVLAAVAFLANPAWPWPGFAWIAGAMLLPGLYIRLPGAVAEPEQVQAVTTPAAQLPSR